MLPGVYPDRDLGTVLALPPTHRPFSVVSDADELIREVSYRGRTAKEPLMLGLARHHLARLFATDRVRKEVERNLPRVAGPHIESAERAWREEYRPLIRWVSIPDRLERGFHGDEDALRPRMRQIMTLHSADAPTAELALLCAPCFVLTGNHAHLHAAGFGDADTRTALVAAGDAAALELNGVRALSLGELATRGTWELGSRAIRLAGDSPLAAGLMLFALAFFAFKAYEQRDQLKTVAGHTANATMDFIQEMLIRHADLLTVLMPSLVAPLQPPTLETRIAQTLARSPSPLAAEAIGYTRLPMLNRDVVLAALRSHPAFVFWRGQGWTMGRHLTQPAQQDIARGTP
jgi:hypothetical protein